MADKRGCWGKAWDRLLLAGVLGVLTSSIVGCGREPENRGEPSVARQAEALSTTATRTYGFESLTDWSAIYSTPTLALSTTHVEGTKSLADSGGGWSSFITRALSKETSAPTIVGFDVRLPTSQPNPDWYGTVEL
jgi:hypothetical protein